MNSDSPDVLEPEEGGTDVLGPEAGGTDVLGSEAGGTVTSWEPRQAAPMSSGHEAGGTESPGSRGRRHRRPRPRVTLSSVLTAAISASGPS